MQLRYQTKGHDSIQYHVFCGDKVFALRIFRTDTLEHHSAWIYDGGMREALSSEAPITQTDASYFDVACPTLSIYAQLEGGFIAVKAERIENAFEIIFKTKASYEWAYDALDAQESVLHQPNLDCVVRYQGRDYQGVGYHKRYYWRNPPRYWGYRFLHGVLGDNEIVWTADAVFGLSKYDYFKMLDSVSGVLMEADRNSCAHKDNLMFGEIGGRRHELTFDALGSWEKALRSSAMDSHMRQQAGTFTHVVGDERQSGVALTEYCFGTLG
ncbi:MAG: hypothetical protein SGJ17_01935 [Hyphomicrobiales bacterium]|nr:hypothetical protein [Hyphomicrobiales bacterium]